MYLKKIRLHNFKSFAGTTEVPFSPGYTGVAGPNGMGKSNISDSILFVLGPSSSKALRADRLTRLFFNGGKTGKPATECEVSLVFDNTDRAMAVDSDEVELTRYVKVAPSDPDGYYSYFYVNGRRTTQGEMDALLARARLSAEGYNVIQQGEVNRIYAMSALERRGLAERLAGIAQYDEDLSKAGDKRTAVEANLTQLGTLLSEVERHIAELDGQRTQAIRHRDLSTSKHQLEVAIARTNLSKLKRDVADTEKRKVELADEVQKLTAGLEELRAKKTETQQEIIEVETEIAKRAGSEAAKIQAEKNARTLETGRLEMALTKAEEALKETTETKASLERELASRRKELKQLKERAEDLGSQVETIEKAAMDHQKTLSAAHDNKELSQKAIELKRRQLVNEREQASKNEDWQKMVQRIEAAKAEIASLEQTRAHLEEELTNRRAEVKDAEYQYKNATSSRKGGETNIQALTDEMHQLKAKEKNLSSSAERLKNELMELNRAYSGLDAKLRERGGMGGGPGMSADFLLAQHNLGKIAGIRGKVEDLISYDAEFATAISVAGGSRLQSLVVDNDTVVALCIELLNKEKKGRVTFLPLNKMTPSRPKGKALVVQHAPGSKGFALDLVKFDKTIEDALWFVFGETLIMDNLDSARKQMGGVRLVTLRGELLEASGAITGGSLSSASRASENAATLKRLSEDLNAKNAEEGGVVAELKKVSERLRQVMEELARHSGEVTGAQTTLAQLEKDLAGARARLKDSEDRNKTTLARFTELSASLEGLTSKSAKIEEELKNLKVEHDETQKQFLEVLPTSLSARMKKLQEEGQEITDQRLTLNRDLEAARSQLATATETLKSRESEFERLKTALAGREAEVKKVGKQLGEEREKLEVIQKVVDSQTQASKALMAKKDALQTEFTKASAEEASAVTTLQTREGIVKEITIQLETKKSSLAEALAANKDDLPELPKELQNKPLAELQRAIAGIDQEIQALGAVNTLAIEQYDAEKKRLDEFQAEVSRLQEEREGLLNLVKELEEKKRSRLSEVVIGINENYQKIYTELSGGGEGEIVLEDPKDPLAGGLLIRARPVGKKVDRLEQLSGGEKSVASLAFIFSLQRYDPSPMYVLDEVDTNLDGVNAENIGRMFRRNAAGAQFIVISLRKVTLKWAEHLFGVTMRGDGRSQVVGLRLDDIKDIDERELAQHANQPNMPAFKPAVKSGKKGGGSAPSPAPVPPSDPILRTGGGAA